MLRKSPSMGVGCSKQTSHPNSTEKSRVWGTETPETIVTKFSLPRAVQDVITPANFLWRSVKGFWCDEGSNFGLFHWLASTPLKHSRTTVRVCDIVVLLAELVSSFDSRVSGITNKRGK